MTKSKQLIYRCTEQSLFPDGSMGAELVEYEGTQKEIWDLIDFQLRGSGKDSAWPEELILTDGTVCDHHWIVREHWEKHFLGFDQQSKV